jgi:hypothetical protein
VDSLPGQVAAPNHDFRPAVAPAAPVRPALRPSLFGEGDDDEPTGTPPDEIQTTLAIGHSRLPSQASAGARLAVKQAVFPDGGLVAAVAAADPVAIAIPAGEGKDGELAEALSGSELSWV